MIKPKIGKCLDCRKERPLTAGRCQSCYWPYRRSLKAEKGGKQQKNSHIAKKSVSKLDREIEYAKIRKGWLPEHRECQAALPGCCKIATQVHHKAGRSGDLLLETDKWLACCHRCHTWITEHSAAAVELGLSLRRNV